MLAMSIHRGRLFPAILIATAAIAFAASHAIVGCLIQKPTLLAAESAHVGPPPTLAATKDAEAIVLRSPNKKFYIRLEATDNGARITLAEGDRKIDLHLTEATGNLFIRSGDCTYAATSSKSYSASTVGHAATGRLTTAYCSALKDKTIESAFACYVLSERNTSANAALYADDNGVGKLQLMRGENHVTVDCPEEDEERGLFDDKPKDTGLKPPNGTSSLVGDERRVTK